MAAIGATPSSGLPPAGAPAAPSAPDAPDATYPTLLGLHVAVLRAAGTPEPMIAAMAQQQPTAEAVDREIQAKILQDPEAWDLTLTQNGYPTEPGTTRAGLTAAFPQITLPAPGTGNPGFTYDGVPNSGIDLPGVTTPIGGGSQMSMQGMLTLGAVGLLGVGGVIGFMKLRNRTAAVEGVAKTQQLGLDAVDQATKGAKGIGGKLFNKGAHDVAEEPTTAQILGLGGGLGDQRQLGMQFAMDQGFGPADGYAMNNGLAAMALNRHPDRIHQENIEMLAVQNGQLSGLAQLRAVEKGQPIGISAEQLAAIFERSLKS